MDALGRVLGIARRLMGTEYRESDFRRYAADDSSWLVIAVGDGPELVYLDEVALDAAPPAEPIHGFAIAGAWDRPRVDREMYGDLDELEENTELSDEDYPIGYFSDIVVREESQGQGIGLALGTELAPLLSRHVTGIIAPVWKRPDSDSSSMVAAFGGRPMYTYDDYGLYESGVNCPVCDDDGDCECTFVMYGDLEIGDGLVPPESPEAAR